ncbi:ion channel [Nocardioides sp. CN2-186]|uniref:ion channel n=1 Tax=Nocardioides tweenelious TaxID=3156607 RepID=UPI0032B42D91
MSNPRVERRIAAPALVVTLLFLLGGAGAAAALESDTVPSFWGGLWWAVSLMTNLGYVYGPPHTTTATVISVVLMVTGFLLMSLLSATLAAVFIRTDAEPAEERNSTLEHEILTRLDEISRRVEALERRLP